MNRKQLIAPALVLALSATALATPSLVQAAANDAAAKPADAAQPVAATATADASKKDPVVDAIMKYSRDGNDAFRSIQAARIAIFNGAPDAAGKLIADAQASLRKATDEAPTFQVTVATSVQGSDVGTRTETDKTGVVPVDGQLRLAEDFVPTPEKTQHIATANQHLSKGESKAALDELRLGAINVTYDRYMMPLAQTAMHLDTAASLMKEQKYYEANLALKAIGDSMSVDSVVLTDLPTSSS